MTRDRRDPWWTFAACRGRAPLFDADFDGQGRADPHVTAKRYQEAADICSACTVQPECDRDWKPGRDEGVRVGRLLPPIEGIGQKRRVA